MWLSAYAVEERSLAAFRVDRASARRIVSSTGRCVNSLNGLQQLASEVNGILKREFEIAAALLRELRLISHFFSHLRHLRPDIGCLDSAQ